MSVRTRPLAAFIRSRVSLTTRVHAPAHSFAYAYRRALFATLLGATTLAAVTYADNDKFTLASATLSGISNTLRERFYAHAEAAPPAQKVSLDDPHSRVDAATAVAHPLILTPASAPDLALVGVGVRTVSFLKMKVYSGAFYVNDYNLKRLGNLPGWEDFTADKLNGPDAEPLIRSLLDAPASVAVRIVPVRNTDFGHLRDGLTRTLLARQRFARSRKELTPEEDERISRSTQDFKNIFPAGSVPKGRQLLLVRSVDGTLSIEYEGKIVGSVNDKWIGDNLILAYFTDINPISQPLKSDSANGFTKWIVPKELRVPAPTPSSRL